MRKLYNQSLFKLQDLFKITNQRKREGGIYNLLHTSSVLDQWNIWRLKKSCIWEAEFCNFEMDVIKWQLNHWLIRSSLFRSPSLFLIFVYFSSFNFLLFFHSLQFSMSTDLWRVLYLCYAVYRVMFRSSELQMWLFINPLHPNTSMHLLHTVT